MWSKFVFTSSTLNLRPLLQNCPNCSVLVQERLVFQKNKSTFLHLQQSASLSLLSPNLSPTKNNFIKMPIVPVAAMAIAAQNRRLHHSLVTKTPIRGAMPVYISPFSDKGRTRSYAKSRDKPKSGKKTVVVINEEEINQVGNYVALKNSLDRQIEIMKDEFQKHLSIRGAAAALELLEVEFEGETYPLQELAQVGRKNPQLVVLNFSSLPDAIKPVLQAIQDSGMGLNPQQEGTTLYIQIPKVTREHRESLAKNAKSIFVKIKQSIQDIQNRFIKQAKGHPEASEDLIFSVTQQIMKLAESYIHEAEKLMSAKQGELLEGN